MGQIAQFLKDPAWWFSAFFVAIIASVLAGYTKDKLDRWLSKLSKNRDDIRLVNERRRNEFVNLIATNQTVLIVEMVRTIGAIIIFFFCLIISILSPMWNQILFLWCSSVTFDPTCKFASNWMGFFPFLLFGFLSIRIGYKASSKAKLTIDGYKQYRKSLKAEGTLPEPE